MVSPHSFSALTLAHCLQSLCSWSLVELYRAFGSSVDAHKAVLAAHPMYANLMERALAKVVLQHVTTLEKFCQVLPHSPSGYCVMLVYRAMCVQHGQQEKTQRLAASWSSC